MQKYYIYKNTPVQFNGNKETLQVFEKENDHLKGKECSKAEYDTLRAVEDEQRRKYRKRKKILEIADANEQLQMIMDNFAHLQMQVAGLTNSKEVNSFIAKRNAIKD